MGQCARFGRSGRMLLRPIRDRSRRTAALFRVADLLELVRLVDRLSGHDLPEGHR